MLEIIESYTYSIFCGGDMFNWRFIWKCICSKFYNVDVRLNNDIDGRWRGARDNAPERLFNLLADPVPEVHFL